MSKLFRGTRISSSIYSVNGFVSGLTVLLIFTPEPETKMPTAQRLLSLGDSYTIGEAVLRSENFPSQTIHLLRQSKSEFQEAEIIAQTGWTTDELKGAIERYKLKGSYNFVTLLIGVNDQYRGRTVEYYKPQFESLLKQAIQFTDGKADHVIVLSIPDWGSTPFAKTAGRDRQQISAEIDAYNKASKEIASNYKANYVDITPGTREAVNDLSLIAGDGLHPSGKEYAKWATRVCDIIQSRIN